MDWFAERGFDTRCFDMEGYGCSDKHRPLNFDIATGADDLAAATDYIMKARGVKQFLGYGLSHASFQQITCLLAYHILNTFFTQPDPIYRG